MGVVLRQSFWTSAFSYIGVIVGYLNTLLILPAYYTPDQIGLYNQIQSAALLLVPLVSLGMGSSAVRFYPKIFSEKKIVPPFLGSLLIGTLIGIVVFSIILFLLSGPIISIYQEKAPEFQQYFWVVLALLAGFTLSNFFELVSKSQLKIVFPNFCRDVLLRLTKMGFLLLFGFNLISFEFSIYSLVISVVILAIATITYTLYLKDTKFSFQTNKLPRDIKSEIQNYSFYAILGSLGNVMIMNVDIQMVSAMMGNNATGIYSMAFYIGVVIDLPRRAISQIASPLLSQAFKENNYDKIANLYKKLGLNQLALGIFLSIGIVVNIDSIYQLIPNNEKFISGIQVVYFIGLSRLIDMAFSTNGEIIQMSKYYRFNVVSVVILAVLTVVLNIILIPIYGITGAALATSMSILIFNIAKFIFVKFKLGLSPFSVGQLTIIALGTAIVLLNTLTAKFDNPILDILIRSTVVTILYIGLLLLLRVSDEMQNIFNQLINKYLKKKN
ncbi:MAG: polysaccharide biosynthesis C-terminal domain-containing protein [bacterium]|nr:polysaccharide biosynthesis C-terminal domain-containing protein [bacterium]